jgi:hypothetical protein
LIIIGERADKDQIIEMVHALEKIIKYYGRIFSENSSYSV